jgi:hypothetical protein
VRSFGLSTTEGFETKMRQVRTEFQRRFPDAPPDALEALEQLQREALAELGSDGLHSELRRRLAPASDR